MSTRDILDAISGIKAAMDGIGRTVDAARDSQGRVSGYVLDVETIERYRDDFRVMFEYLEDSYRGTVTSIRRASDDPARPFLNLMPLVTVLREYRNPAVDGGFVHGPDGWRCRMARPLDLSLLRRTFVFPRTIHLSEADDRVVDQQSGCVIEGPGAARAGRASR